MWPKKISRGHSDKKLTVASPFCSGVLAAGALLDDDGSNGQGRIFLVATDDHR